MFRGIIGAALLALGLAGPAWAADPAPAPWDAKFYNPDPAPGDFILPLPCGGAMVFRRIETPTGTSPLDDRSVTLGDADPDTNYAEFVRQAALAGNFTDKGKRFFYLGKYKVTADQAKAISGTCPTPSNAGRLPAVGLGWFDAVDLAYKYNLWLYKNARDKLPANGDARGFVRLPTEAEWEYAARGGAAVSDAEFRARLFPMQEDISRYAWFQGSQSAAGELHAVGLLKPNPLGLYDIIGDADEIVLDPFRLNKVGRLHGEAGGFTVKGGDFRTAEERLRASMRIELPPFDPRTGEPVRLSTVGVRFAIGSVAIASLKETTALQTAFNELSTRAEAPANDPQAVLDKLIKETTEPGLKKGLEAVAADLRQETRARKEFEERAVRSSISAGAVLARSIRDLYFRAEAIGKYLDTAKIDAQQRRPNADKEVAEFSQSLANVQEYQRNNVAAYAQLVIEVSDDYDAATVDSQLKITQDDLEAKGLSKLEPWAQMFVAHTRDYRKAKKADTARWLKEMVK